MDAISTNEYNTELVEKMASPSESTRPRSSCPKVKSNYHRGTFCGPCIICGQEQERYDHFDGLSQEVQQFLLVHSGMLIPGNSCICRNHRREALHHQSNSGYIPVWKKKPEESLAPEQTNHQCMYKDCAVTSSTGKIIAPSMETLESFRKVLDTTEHSVFLCDKHYRLVYCEMHEHVPCAGCGAKPKVRQNAYSQHSPDLFTISVYLSGCTNFNQSQQPPDQEDDEDAEREQDDDDDDDDDEEQDNEETDEEWTEEREDIETEIVTDTLFDISTYLHFS